jgi:hypothetical protein
MRGTRRFTFSPDSSFATSSEGGNFAAVYLGVACWVTPYVYYNFSRLYYGNELLVPLPLREANWVVSFLLQAEDLLRVVRYTRHWIHYGFLAHIGLCTLIAAVEGLLGR